MQTERPSRDEDQCRGAHDADGWNAAAIVTVHAQVLNIGSTLGSLRVPGFSVYGANRPRFIYTESLRRELADSTVRVQ